MSLDLQTRGSLSGSPAKIYWNAMPFPAKPLSHYCQQVPTCPYPATWQQLASIRSELTSPWLIFVSDCQHPVGAIAYHRLFALLGERSQLLSPPSAPSLSGTEQFAAGVIPQLIEPFQVFSAQTLVTEFLARGFFPNRAPYGLVDGEGRFLGLVDSAQILGEIARANCQEKVEWGGEKPPYEWLERLPLPLQIQNTSGIVTYQNSLWQQEVGEPLLTSANELWQNGNRGSDVVLPYPEIAAQLSCRQWLEHRSRLGQEENTLASDSLKDRIWQLTKCPLQGEIGWLTIALDVTQFQQTIRDLNIQNQEIISFHSLKNQVLEYICHELKSPSTSLLGLANLLARGGIGAVSDRQIQYLEMLLQSGRQIMAQVNELQDLAAAAFSPTDVGGVEVSLRDLCQSILQVIQDRYSNRQLSVLIVGGGSNLRITNAPRLKCILIYLLDRALRSAAPAVSYQLIAERREQLLQMEIAPEEDRDAGSSWQVLSQENPVSQQLQELGFGVVLAQQWLQSLGGELSWCKGECGDAFLAIVPEFQAAEESDCRSTRAWVLVADTQPDRVESLRSQLFSLGYEVWVASSGLKALERARCLQPQLIFIHPDLPHLTGWEVLTLLKSTAVTRAIPVALIDDGGERPSLLPFAEDFSLSPPFCNRDLQQILQPSPQCVSLSRSLRILQLCPESGSNFDASLNCQFALDSLWMGQFSQGNHRILEADDLDQADMLAQVWEVDALVLDGRQLHHPDRYLARLKDYPSLTKLPWIVLDAPTAEAANAIPDLSVFPYLLSDINPDLEQFWQVLQIATGTIVAVERHTPSD